MSKFRKNSKRGQQPVNTAALPDIVFMLLFFFMVATRPKENEPEGVKIKIPESTMSIELNKDDKVDYIWAGYPANSSPDEKPLVQVFLDDQYTVDYTSKLGEWKTLNKPEGVEIHEVTSILKVDNEVDMRTVFNIKEALRDVNALRINYSTKDK